MPNFSFKNHSTLIVLLICDWKGRFFRKSGKFCCQVTGVSLRFLPEAPAGLSMERRLHPTPSPGWYLFILIFILPNIIRAGHATTFSPHDKRQRNNVTKLRGVHHDAESKCTPQSQNQKHLNLLYFHNSINPPISYCTSLSPLTTGCPRITCRHLTQHYTSLISPHQPSSALINPYRLLSTLISHP